MTADTFALIEMTLRVAGTRKQPPAIRYGGAIERSVPVQVVCPADGVIGVQALARVEAQFGHVVDRSEPVETPGAAVGGRARQHVVGQ